MDNLTDTFTRIKKMLGLIALLVLAGPTIGWAQAGAGQVKFMTEEMDKLQQELKKKAAYEQNMMVPSGIDLPSLTNDYTVFTNDQTWSFVDNPFNAFNLLPNNSGQWAGDINGDGRGDFIMREFPDGPKTIVYYGGSSGIQPDQIIDRWLSPIGDINADGHTDAVHHYGGEILLGSTNGYQHTGNNLSRSNIAINNDGGVNDYGLQDNLIIPAGDLDGDGLNDVIHFSTNPYNREPFGNKDFAVYWGDSTGQFGLHFDYYSIEPQGDRFFEGYVLNTGDFNGDGTNEIYIFGNDIWAGEHRFRIFDIPLDRSHNPILQDILYGPAMQNLTQNYGLHIIDINGDGFNEIFLSPDDAYGYYDNYVYTEDPNNPGMYGEGEINVFFGTAHPVGDLNDDGRLDFFVGDPDNNNAPYLSHGPAVLTDGLALDTHLSFASDHNWEWQYTTNYPYSVFGDMDGDGIDDFTAGMAFYASNETGFVKVFGNASGAPTFQDERASISDFLDRLPETRNVGDVNGDDIDDFALNRLTIRQVEIFFGGETISEIPDVTLNASFEYSTGLTGAIGVDGGDFNNDGFSDVVISSNVGNAVRVFYGGENMDGEANHEIVGEDFKQDGGSISTFYFVNNVGDVNNDGVEDFMLGSLHGGGENENSEHMYYNEAYLFLGGGTLPNAPDATISLFEAGPHVSAGREIARLGDMNGDNIDDFAISTLYGGTNGQGMVQVFYGNESANFTSSDLELTVPDDALDHIFQLGYDITGGDFDGDGYADLAASIRHTAGDAPNEDYNSNIFIYLGGENADNEPDHFLKIDPESVGMEYENMLRNNGIIATIPDHDGNGADELLSFPSFGTNNAVVFSGNLNSNNQQTLILKSPNSAIDMGASYNNAIGDFTGEGEIDIITENGITGNVDAARRFAIPRPITISSVEDVPEDQGGWVRVTVDGYYMDALNADILGFDHWAVWLQDGDKWTNVGTAPAYNESANYIDVHVSKTQASENTDESTTYNFKVTALNNAGNNIAESEIVSGFALDNLAPSAVTGVTANRGADQVSLSWNAPEDNDIASYEIVAADNVETPLVTTQQTSLTLSDADYSGIQQLLVRARDIHSNIGTSSEKAVAIFPVDLNYEVRENWNLVGLPLNADPADIEPLLSQVSENALYEYNGSYEPVETIEPGKGYWAKFPAVESYQVAGLPLAEQTLELQSGWNLISGLGASFDYSQIKDPNGILIEGAIAGFDGSYTETEVLAPGSGYWIRTSEAGSITLSLLEETSTTTLDKKASPLAEAKSQLNSITVRSSEGYQNTLYFGDKLPKQVDPLSFSLPPVPPGEGFDVRFTGEDMRYSEANTFTLNLQKAFHSELTVSLDLLSTHSYQSYSVQELKGAKVLAEYTLDNETEVKLRNNGATALKVTPSVVSDFTDDRPAQFALSPSYPNPFNPSTNIQYELPQQVAVNLEVYNMIGRKVSTLLANQQQGAGVHTVRFDASALSSGMYFVRLKAGSFEQIQKITLIK